MFCAEIAHFWVALVRDVKYTGEGDVLGTNYSCCTHKNVEIKLGNIENLYIKKVFEFLCKFLPFILTNGNYVPD